MKKYLEILGHEVEDVVTGISGIATTVGFDLYGCVQVIVTPKVNKENKDGEQKQYWFDHKRLKITRANRVMPAPNFAAYENLPPKEEPGGDLNKPVR